MYTRKITISLEEYDHLKRAENALEVIQTMATMSTTTIRTIWAVCNDITQKTKTKPEVRIQNELHIKS